MIFAAILAGGSGTRMGNIEKPKQFLKLNEKPILIHTVEKFSIMNEFTKILILVPKKWINYTKDIIKKYIENNQNITVIESGKLRNDTIMKATTYLNKLYTITEEDILVTHDSVRPFVSYRIIKENITILKNNEVCDTVIPSTDTIVESTDAKHISNIPKRNYMYQGQTPQSFKIKKFEKYYTDLNDNEKESLSDAAKIFVMNNEKVALVKGDVTNMKITYQYDLNLAETIIKESKTFN